MRDQPIISVSISGMRESLRVAVVEHSEEINTILQNAIDEYCTPANLQSVILSTVRTQINKAVQDAIKHYYQYGEGREEVKKAVEEALQKGEY